MSEEMPREERPTGFRDIARFDYDLAKRIAYHKGITVDESRKIVSMLDAAEKGGYLKGLIGVLSKHPEKSPKEHVVINGPVLAQMAPVMTRLAKGAKSS